MAFELELLGGASLNGPEGPVRGRAAHKRRLALLALLTVAERPVARERVIGLLWPEHPGEAARHLLSESLYVLRKELGEDAVVSTGDEIHLNGEVVSSDVARFAGALAAGDPASAVGVYRGPFLEGFVILDAPDFERWADEQRDRLSTAYSAALETLATRAAQEGDTHLAVAWWRRLAAYEPLSSRVAIALVRALADAGERAAALRHAAIHATFLRAELEIDPPAELARFVDSLRARENADDQPRAPAGNPPAGERSSDPHIEHPSAPREDEGRDPALEQRVLLAPKRFESRRLAVVAFADVVGFGAMRLRDEGAAAAVLDILQHLTTREMERAGGRVLEIIGDGVLTEFPDAVSAAEASLRLVRGFERRCRPVTGAALRIGVAHGEVATASDGGFYGAAVTLATRLQEAADAGAVVLAGPVAREMQGHQAFALSTPPRSAAVVDSRARVVSRPPRVRPAAPATGAPALRHPRSRRVMAAAAAVCVLLAGTGIAWVPRILAPAPAGSDALDRNRIAVLAFRDLSPDASLSYLATGVGEHLVGQLGSVQGLAVVAPSAVAHYQRKDIPPDSLARIVRAGSLVEASVERTVDRVRILLRLIDGASGTVIATASVERPEARLFELEDGASRELSRLLRSWVGWAVVLPRLVAGIGSEEARTLFLRARTQREIALATREQGDRRDEASVRQGLLRADSLFAAAAARAPGWTAPVVGRGRVLLDLASLRDAPVATEMSGAEAFANAALRMAPGDTAALELRGTARFLLAATAPTAEDATRLAELAATDLRAAGGASALALLSQLLRTTARYAEAEEVAKEASVLDAYLFSDADIRDRRLRAAMLMGRYEEAWSYCRTGQVDFADDPRFLECELSLLARDPSAPPDTARAWALVRRLEPVGQLPRGTIGRGYRPLFRRAMVAAVLARAGASDIAWSVLARARADASTEPGVAVDLLYDDAWISLALGDTAHAADAIRRYLRSRPLQQAQVARDPHFTGLAQVGVRLTGKR